MNFKNAKTSFEFYRRYYKVIDALGLLAIAVFSFTLFAPEALWPNAPTGGDMGSHFWPLLSLIEHGIPNGTVRMWNPGNLAGEPFFVHYFPLPFIMMAVISFFTAIGTAFKIGVLLPVFFFPFSVYYSMRGLGFRFPAPLFAAALSCCFLYNESYAIYGGTALSVMAGQFAHSYALNFMLLWLGRLGHEIRKKKYPFVSPFLFTAVLLSHAYVFLGLPFLGISLLFFFPFHSQKERLKKILHSVGLGMLLSLGFLIPMLDNQKWTTPYAIQWSFNDIKKEAFSWIYLPIGIGSLLGLFSLGKKWFRSRVAFWLLPIMGYLIYFFIARPMGVVNMRSIPQMQLFLTLLAAMGLASFCVRFFGMLGTWIIGLPLVLICLIWANSYSLQFKSWQTWNFGGWENKPLYPPLSKMMADVKGDFNSLRLFYEHSDINNGAGTVRVFEMIPYFSGRATLESVYLQASIVAPMIFHMQSMTSSGPSCPFWDFECPQPDMNKVKPMMDLFAISQIIIATDKIREQLKKSPHFTARGKYGPWQIYDLKNPRPYVELFSQPPVVKSEMEAGRIGENKTYGTGWKALFHDWFMKYNGTQPLIVVNQPHHRPLQKDAKFWPYDPHCRPEIKIGFNELRLKTPCPGKPHYLKFAYHSSWRTNTRDSLFLVSPGFIGITPSQNEVILQFGKSRLWLMCTWISILALIGLVIGFFFNRIRKK